MFAIGRCADCDAPVCGEADCSDRIEGRFLCSRCASPKRRVEREARAQEQQAEVDRANAAEQVLAEKLIASYDEEKGKFLAAVEELPDSVERLVLAVAHTSQVNGSELWSCQNPDVLSSLFPDLWPSRDAVKASDSNPPWDATLIARWFAERARAMGVPFAGRRALWWMPTFRTLRHGWVFVSPERSTPEGEQKQTRNLRIFVNKDGRLYRESSPLDPSPSRRRALRANNLAEGGQFAGGGLVQMVEMLDLSDRCCQIPPAPRRAGRLLI
jgi:hypothetical protein